MMQQIIATILAAVLGAVSLSAIADEHRERRGREAERHWVGGEIHRFHEHDVDIWRGGRWYNGRHGGQHGWWWIAAGVWYFYPSPVYPYPDPYIPPVVIEQQAPVVVAPPATAPAQPPAQFWYYCESAKGYYPYVSACPAGWKSVPAQPPQGVAH